MELAIGVALLVALATVAVTALAAFIVFGGLAVISVGVGRFLSRSR